MSAPGHPSDVAPHLYPVKCSALVSPSRFEDKDACPKDLDGQRKVRFIFQSW